MIESVSSSISGVGQKYSPPSMSISQNEFVAELLSDYDVASLTESDIQAINDAFQEEGIVPSRDLREAIENAGFNPDDLRKGGGGPEGGGPPPPPPPPTASQEEEKLNALLQILEEYQGETLSASNINEIQQKLQESGYATNGAMFSIMA